MSISQTPAFQKLGSMWGLETAVNLASDPSAGRATMWLLIGMCVLLCETAGSDNTENGTASLPCGTSTPTRPVIWSRNKGKEKILSLLDGKDQETKYIIDTGRRYGAAADCSLTITGVSHSDSGIYDCNGIPVQLQVITGGQGQGRGQNDRQTAKDGDQDESDEDHKQGGGSSAKQDADDDDDDGDPSSLTVVTTAATTTSTEGTQGSSSVQTVWIFLGTGLAALPFITATAAAVWAHSGGGAMGISQ
ncbi:hypothetical protein JZ751_013531 [Albula glossodonta]|uniref:Ig-like domain-containing protein n=1 Tax=Albula glossodonta TaxID=121402 RepID=A0A8T2MVL7_9TELE|nr:hypothetical protein JZ751_013531 [Albula glossodonta]